MNQYTYYPGCSAEGANKAYHTSARCVSETLGVELVDLPDWNCCGASTYTSVDQKRAMALSARNLALAEREARDLVAICSGCFCALSKTNRYLAESEALARELSGALDAAGLEYRGTVRVRHLLDVFVNDVGQARIRDSVAKSLSGLRVAPYYGCQLSRPKGMFGDPEFPTEMDDLLSWLGAEPVRYPLKAKCCGGMLMTTRSDVCETLVLRLLSAAVEAEAECIATICPLCQINLEAYQNRINKRFGTRFDMPIFYFTQLTGLALGLGEKELRFRDNLTPSEPILARY